MPSLRLVNKASLDRVLQAEIYINELDGQLRAAHLILGYNPISRAFQTPSCVIKAKDPRLRRISVAYEGVHSPLRRSSPQIFPAHRTTACCQPCSSSNIFPPPRFTSRGGRKSRTRGRRFCGPHLGHRRLRSLQSIYSIT